MRSLPDTSAHEQQWESNPRPFKNCIMHISVEQGGLLLTVVGYVFIDVYSKLVIRQDNITN